MLLHSQPTYFPDLFILGEKPLLQSKHLLVPSGYFCNIATPFSHYKQLTKPSFVNSHFVHPSILVSSTSQDLHRFNLVSKIYPSKQLLHFSRSVEQSAQRSRVHATHSPFLRTNPAAHSLQSAPFLSLRSAQLVQIIWSS